jgi:hypothetical protein
MKTLAPGEVLGSHAASLFRAGLLKQPQISPAAQATSLQLQSHSKKDRCAIIKLLSCNWLQMFAGCCGGCSSLAMALSRSALTRHSCHFPAWFASGYGRC